MNPLIRPPLAADLLARFAAIVGEINGDGACWGRLRWGAETPPQFPPGLTVYVPQPDGSFVPPLDPAIDAAIPVIG